MQTILDSLDDISCLQESQPQERAHLLSLLEDTNLHILLEVSIWVRSACPRSIRQRLAACTTAIDRRQQEFAVAAVAVTEQASIGSTEGG